jgi:Rod binding domain-containing protein
MREAARAFEAAFLAEMLKHSGLGETPEAFGGGVGERQFASLMREAQARHMAEAGGIGLAEQIFESLLAREAADGDGPG